MTTPGNRNSNVPLYYCSSGITHQGLSWMEKVHAGDAMRAWGESSLGKFKNVLLFDALSEAMWLRYC